MSENLLQKRMQEIWDAIKPICDCFDIKCDYTGSISIKNNYISNEYLTLNGTKICITSNSLSAIRDEVIGYIFINTYCRNRSLGAFDKQTKNVIKRYWVKD